MDLEIQTTRARRPKSPDWKRQTNKQRKQIDRARGSVLVPKNMPDKKSFMQKFQEIVAAFSLKRLMRRQSALHRRRVNLALFFNEWREEHGGALKDIDFPNRRDVFYLRGAQETVLEELARRNIHIAPLEFQRTLLCNQIIEMEKSLMNGF